MSEWLTTGQMIDKLKVGEVAEAESLSGYVYKVKKRESGSIMCLDLKGAETGHFLTLEVGILNSRWRILPQHVTFEEAMKALEENKIVEFYPPIELNPNVIKFRFRKDNEFTIGEMGNENLTFKHLIEGKWTIVEESK